MKLAISLEKPAKALDLVSFFQLDLSYDLAISLAQHHRQYGLAERIHSLKELYLSEKLSKTASPSHSQQIPSFTEKKSSENSIVMNTSSSLISDSHQKIMNNSDSNKVESNNFTTKSESLMLPTEPTTTATINQSLSSVSKESPFTSFSKKTLNSNAFDPSEFFKPNNVAENTKATLNDSKQQVVAQNKSTKKQSTLIGFVANTETNKED